jgi:hypothetical protein
MVPVRLVSAVASPMASVLPRAVVRKAGMERESPDELPVTPIPPVTAVFNPRASFDALAVVRKLGMLIDRPEVFPVIPIDPVTAVFSPRPPPAPGAAAERERVNPLEADAVVPVKLVRASVGLPCEWLTCAAVVRKAGKFRLTPDEFIVALTPLAVRAELSPSAGCTVCDA